MSSFASKTLLRASVATVAVLFSASMAFAGGLYSVDLNKTEIVRLPENAGAVVIGNQKSQMLRFIPPIRFSSSVADMAKQISVS